jgi:hypothetical protein
MNRQRFLIPALVILTLARLLMLVVHPLSEVELHALKCSSQPDIWHQGLGPVLPLLIKVSTSVFGEHEFGVRFFSPLLILGASLALWRLASGLFDETTATWTQVIFQLTPLVNLAAITFTPTTLGMVSSIFIMWLLRLCLHRDHKLHLYWWALGLGLMLTFFIDWRLGALGLSVTGGMALTSRGQRALAKWPVLPILAGCGALAVTLFISWNSEHHWQAFAQQADTHRAGLLSMGIQLLLAFSPLLLTVCGWSLVQSATRRPVIYAVGFLYAYAWPLITLDLLSWHTLPWPQAGLGTWLAPASMLLAHHVLGYDSLPVQQKLWLRATVLLMAGTQSCLIVHGTLPRMMGFSW